MICEHSQPTGGALLFKLLKVRENLNRNLNAALHARPTPTDKRWICKGNLTDLRRILHLSLAKGNPK
jgi:hypothetical protein